MIAITPEIQALEIMMGGFTNPKCSATSLAEVDSAILFCNSGYYFQFRAG